MIPENINVDLKPDRNLLDSNFDGYKLSLEEIPHYERPIPVVHKKVLDPSEYSILHTRVFGLYNHLIIDPDDESDPVYFVDEHMQLCKAYMHTRNDKIEMMDPVVVWKVLLERERVDSDYNVSLVFVNNTNYVALSDGMGSLYILSTGGRHLDDSFFFLDMIENVLPNGGSFLVIDAVMKDPGEYELHVLLLSIEKNSATDKCESVVHWLSFKRQEMETWVGPVEMRQFRTKGYIEYMYIEPDCEAIYIACDAPCKCVLNSEFPIAPNTNTSDTKHIFQWSQTSKHIKIKFELPEAWKREKLKTVINKNDIEIVYDNNDKVLIGELFGNIIIEENIISIADNILKITLSKEDEIVWADIVKTGVCHGEYVEEKPVLGQTEELIPQNGATFGTQDLEECDFETEKESALLRFCGKTNQITHRIPLGSQQLRIAVKLEKLLPHAIGIRHDVDVCIWQPIVEDQKFTLRHEGTLLAFAYVQASKQNRKFSACAPDFSYSVICESSRHLLIYRQKKPVESGELRNRSNGREIHNVAQQQVVSLPPDMEVLGLQAHNKYLYVLGKEKIMSFKMH